ncbi:GNAT family N-acetyltransferase [Rubritalea marina]|uniref:GNAT family N-acetyltransferase n=1 Tax=Rubritalea marina TaxID=361055 RepID=UPI00036AC3CD|nr:GNAT family N-acetyltransferase [Rubritalea marina]
MSTTADLRGLLHYVPIFRGKTFVVDVRWDLLTTAGQAEFVLDICALQSIGVKLVIVSSEDELDRVLDWAVEHEFRSSVLTGSYSGSDVAKVLERGQAAMMPRQGSLLSAGLLKLSTDLDAAKVIAVADFVLKASRGDVVRFLTVKEAEQLPSNLTAEHQSLLDHAVAICRGGVDRVHLLDGGEPGVILKELFSNEGVGTMVYAGVYRQIRTLKEEDISELLGLIGRSVKRTHLVPRTYEEVAESLEDYAVIEVDGNVLGCVALYCYERVGEIACLFVKQNHEGTGYGKDLVDFMEQRARDLGMESIFALTNTASKFFEERLGFQPIALESLPVERRESLVSSGRNSLAYCKNLSS